MEVKGTTHFRMSLNNLYHSGGSLGSTYNKFSYSHIYGYNMVTVKVDNRWIIPLARDFYGFIAEVESDRITSVFNDSNCERYIIPLIPRYNHTGWTCTVKRTADPLISFLLTGTMNTGETLRTAKSASGETYYGGGGCVLDKDFTPLIIFAMEVIYPEGKVTKLNPVSIINPIVFQREDLLSKYIVKKVIPLLSDYSFGEGMGNALRYKDPKMKTIITNEINKFIKTPAKPVGFLDNELWKCAESNLNEMLL